MFAYSSVFIAIRISELAQQIVLFAFYSYAMPLQIWRTTKRFLKLRNNLPPCDLCMFGQEYRRSWRHKTSAANVGGIIRNPKSAAPGERVCTDQLVLAQPGLVPQEKGLPMQARIWGATVFVDVATDWIKVCLMQDTISEST